MVAIARQDHQPVFVLHTYPFKETSLVVELFGRNFGRISAVAKGARRPRSAMRGMLQSFQPLIAAWSGKSELRTLHSLEWDTGLLLLTGEPLMCGFYLNELLLRLLPKEDAHETLFDYYAQTLRALAKGAEVAPTLRRFELKLLQELGYAVPLLQTDAGALIEDDVLYDYVPEHGACANEGLLRGVLMQGRTLLAMANDDYSQVQTKVQSKQLMRMLIGYYLNDKPLHTRQLLMDLNEL